MAQTENRDAHCDSQRSTKEYLKDRTSCKFPAAVQPENVPESILHQADEVRLKRQVRKQGKEMQSIRSK